MIELLFQTMRGEPLPVSGSPELRVRCAELLLNRAYGKAKELIELVDEDSEAARQQRHTILSALTSEELAQLRALLQRGLERAERGGPSPVVMP